MGNTLIYSTQMITQFLNWCFHFLRSTWEVIQKAVKAPAKGTKGAAITKVLAKELRNTWKHSWAPKLVNKDLIPFFSSYLLGLSPSTA